MSAMSPTETTSLTLAAMNWLSTCLMMLAAMVLGFLPSSVTNHWVSEMTPKLQGVAWAWAGWNAVANAAALTENRRSRCFMIRYLVLWCV